MVKVEEAASPIDAPINVERDRTTPPVWVVARHVGESSEPWMWRQLVGFRRVRPHVVCWEHKNRESYPFPNHRLHLLDTPADPPRGPSRWWFRLRRLPGRNFWASGGAERRRLLALARRTAPQAMLCHFGHMALRMLPLAERLRIPLVAHFHGMDLSSMLSDRWYSWSLPAALPRFRAIIVVGEHQRRWMLAHGVPAERVHLIPCGVPTEQFQPATRTDADRLRVICVTRLVKTKGVDFAVRAFSALARCDPTAELCIIGDGAERSDLEALVHELGLDGRVRFLGPRSSEEVREWMQRSDIFIQHSINGQRGWTEGFGVSIAEAASTGLPVLVTDCGGIVDQVEDGKTGFIVGQRDLDALTRALLQLAGDPDLRRRFGSAGRQRVVRLFDTQRQIRRLEDTLLEAISGRREPSPVEQPVHRELTGGPSPVC